MSTKTFVISRSGTVEFDGTQDPAFSGPVRIDANTVTEVDVAQLPYLLTLAGVEEMPAPSEVPVEVAPPLPAPEHEAPEDALPTPAPVDAVAPHEEA